MITWCSYCQRFLGEKPPLTDFSMSHGICPDCIGKAEFSAPRLNWVQDVRDFFLEVGDRAMHGRPLGYSEIATAQKSLNISDYDLLMGIIQPVLYEIGKRFAEGRLKVAIEHNFTMFCEDLLKDMRGSRTHDILYSGAVACDNLLVCVDGNWHSLGVQFTSFFLRQSATKTISIYPGLPAEEIIDLIRFYKPTRLGISVAMDCQLPWLNTLARHLKKLPPDQRPEKYIVGGYLFRTGPVTIDPLFTVAPFEISALLNLFAATRS